MNVCFNLNIKRLLDVIMLIGVPNLRQLVPRALQHVNIAYAQWLRAELSDVVVNRLAILAIHDVDAEVRHQALNVFRHGLELFYDDLDDEALASTINVFVLQHPRRINRHVSF